MEQGIIGTGEEGWIGGGSGRRSGRAGRQRRGHLNGLSGLSRGRLLSRSLSAKQSGAGKDGDQQGQYSEKELWTILLRVSQWRNPPKR